MALLLPLGVRFALLVGRALASGYLVDPRCFPGLWNWLDSVLV
jgi:hypothetical protein